MMSAMAQTTDQQKSIHLHSKSSIDGTLCHSLPQKRNPIGNNAKELEMNFDCSSTICLLSACNAVFIGAVKTVQQIHQPIHPPIDAPENSPT